MAGSRTPDARGHAPPRPATPSPATAPPIRPARDGDRAYHPDPSGAYQQITTIDLGDQRRPLTLHLHRAGRMIAGWFALPPGKTAEHSTAESWPAGLRPGCGSLVAHIREPDGRGPFEMRWWLATQESADGNNSDPTDLIARDSSPPIRVGTLLIVPSSSGQSAVAVRFDARAEKSDTFVRYSTDLRVPWSVIRDLDQAARTAALVRYVRPLAPYWVTEIVFRLCGQELHRLLEVWQAISPSNRSKRKAARRGIEEHLGVHDLEPSNMPEPHHAALIALVRSALSQVPMTVGDVRKDTWSWLEIVAAEAGQGEVILPRTPAAVWLHLGMNVAEQGYAYIVDFDALSPERLAKTVAEKLVKWDVILGLRGSAAVFLLSVRRLPVRFVRRDGVPVRDDDGNLVVADQDALRRAQSETGLIAPLNPVESERIDKTGTFVVGVFVELGAGMGIDVTVRKPADRIGTRLRDAVDATSEPGGSAKLGQVTFFSTLRVEIGDLHGAVYTVVPLRGPSAGAGPARLVGGPATALHQMFLRSGAVLERVETTGLKGPSVPLPRPQQLFSRENIAKLLKPALKFRVFDIGLGIGWMRVLNAPPPALRPPPTTVVGLLRLGSARHLVFFDRDRWQLRTSADWREDARLVLETHLATARGLIGPTATIVVEGHTSPEGTEEHNLQLSSNRAQTVASAIEDALLEITDVTDIGRGEWLARHRYPAGGELDNPPDDPEKLKEFERERDDQTPHWPKWRRVDVRVDGQLLIEGFASA